MYIKLRKYKKKSKNVFTIFKFFDITYIVYVKSKFWVEVGIKYGETIKVLF